MHDLLSAEVRETIILPTLSAPDGAGVNITRRVCGFAGMDLSPIPAKEIFLLCGLCVSNDRREWA